MAEKFSPMYTRVPTMMEATIIAPALLGLKLMSSLIWVTASNPTKAHGATTSTPRMPNSGGISGLNAGPMLVWAATGLVATHITITAHPMTMQLANTASATPRVFVLRTARYISRHKTAAVNRISVR